MAYCRKCGTQLAEGAAFCHVCGAAVEGLTVAKERRSKATPGSIAMIAGIALVAIILISVFAATVIPSMLGGIAGSGHLVTRQESSTGFNSVSISTGFRFAITQAPHYGVNLTIDDNLVNYLQVSQVGDTLYVGLAPGHPYLLASLQVAISMPDLSHLDVSGGATGTTKGFVVSHPITITASGGSTVTSAGSATDLTVNASGGSRVDLSGLHVSNAVVDISGGSQVTVNADGRLDLMASGGSWLYYLGNPTLGNISTSGGSGISKE